MGNKTGEAPVFVKIEEYNDVLDMLEFIKNKLNEAKRTLANIREMKNEEDSELDMWKTNLHEIERKIDGIDRTLFEPESTW